MPWTEISYKLHDIMNKIMISQYDITNYDIIVHIVISCLFVISFINMWYHANTMISYIMWCHRLVYDIMTWIMISYTSPWCHNKNYDITFCHFHISHDIGVYITLVISHLWYHMWYHNLNCDIISGTVISHDPRFQMYQLLIVSS